MVRIGRESFARRAVPVLGGAAAASAVWYTATFDPAHAGWFPSCAFRASTGLLCPGCGMTRAFHHLFHGDVVTATAYNPLVVPVALGLVAVTAIAAVSRWRGRPVQASPPTAWIVAAVVLLAGFAVLRNVVDLGHMARL